MGKDVVRSGYNAIAADYTSARTLDSNQLAFLQDLANRLPPGAAVLDAGCGAGVPVARWLSERFTVTGVDISEEQIRLARQSVPGATFLCQDMTALDFPDASFDAICSLYAVIHVPREEHPALLRCFRRWLKPGGFLLLGMGSGDNPDDVEDFFGHPMYWSHYDAETNLRMTREAGFEILRSELLPDCLDPELASYHLFLLAQKPAAADRAPLTEEEIQAAAVGEISPLSGPIQIVDYDPAWPLLFQREANRIRAALGDRVLLLEHAGSTSVPGLAAKPRIDMILAEADSADEPAYIPDLEAAGYVLRIREPDWYQHRLLRGPDTDINLHVFSLGCPEIGRMLLFRDHLRRHDPDRQLYERAKRRLAAQDWTYMQNYADAKTAVVEEIIARAQKGESEEL